MNRKVIVTATLILLVLGGYYIYNNMFPLADPIQYPSIENIISINIITDNNKEDKVLGTDFASLITYIGNAEPTRIMTSNESPLIRPYYKIQISTEEKTYNYYLYKDDKKVYIKCLYEGIYIVDGEIMNIMPFK